MVLNYRKPGFWVTLVALIAAVAVGVCLLTSPKELTDLEKCEQALEKWQGMEVYELQVSNSSVGNFVETDLTQSYYFALDGEYLMKYVYGDDLGHWRHWKDGKGYHYQFGSLDAEWVDSGWKEDSFDKSAVVHWSMELQWDDLVVQHKESLNDGKTIILTVEQSGWGTGTMSFFFDDDGALWSISRTYTLGNDDGLSSVCTSTVEMKDREREWIKKTFEELGVAPELVCLYRELEELQSSENVHLVIDQQIESEYPGWKTCRQEFLYTGDRFYRNFDYQSAAGAYTTSYLEYGNAVYAREYSDAGVVANRDWARIQDKSAGELTLLNLDWTRFEVLSIVKNQDGTTVITLQGDLNPTEDTVYHEKTYEFHLDLRGKLTMQIVRYHTTKQISDGFAQGTFAFRGQDTVHILNTPREELTERILEVTMEVLDYRSTAKKTIPK